MQLLNSLHRKLCRVNLVLYYYIKYLLNWSKRVNCPYAFHQHERKRKGKLSLKMFAGRKVKVNPGTALQLPLMNPSLSPYRTSPLDQTSRKSSPLMI